MISALTFSDIISNSLKMLFKNILKLAPIALACNLPTIGIQLFFVFGGSVRNFTGNSSGANSFGICLDVIVGVVQSHVLAGALSFAVIQALQNRPIIAHEAIVAGLQRFFPVLGVAICGTLLICVGFCLLAIPGFISLCMLYVATPACVVERTNVIESLRRSSKLTEGYRWKIFWIRSYLYLMYLFFLRRPLDRSKQASLR